MRRTLFLLAIIVPASVLLGLLWDSGSSLISTGPTLAHRSSSTDPRATESASRPHALALAEGSGADLFLQADADAIIGGKTVRYPRSYAAAGSYLSAGKGIVVASEPIMVFNERPQNEHDLARLLMIDVSGGSRRAAKDLAARLAGHTGIRANTARITGDVDLSRVSRIEFSGEVRATIVDPEVPDDEARLATESLILDLDGREVVAIRTEAAFTITRPRTNDFVLSGRGFHADVKTRKAKLLHDVRLDATVARGNEAPRPPLTLTTPGPIDLLIGAPPGKPRAFTLAGSRAVTTAGVAFAQGDMNGVAEDATVVCNAASKIESVELVGNVRLESAGDQAEGSRLLVTPENPARMVRMEGHPVVVRLGRRSAALPGAIRSEVTVTTFGAIAISAVKPGADGRPGRSFEAGPGVSITSETGELSAARAVAWKSEEKDAETPFHVTFEAARGREQESELSAAQIDAVRKGVGVAAVDQVTLYGPYFVLYRPKPAPPAPAAGPAETRRDVPKVGGNPVSIEGAGTIELTNPVLGDRPMVVVVRDTFHMDSLGPVPGKSKGTLDAESARAELESEGPARRPGSSPSRTLTSFTAERRVRLDLPDRARARGEKLSYDARENRVTLSGGGAGEPAHVQRTVPGSHDWLQAGNITFHQDILLIVATSGVDAELALTPLPWIGDPKRKHGETVLSKVHAQRMTASLDRARYAKGELAPTDVTAEVAVKLTQPERTLSADYVRLDAVRRSGSGRGSPLRYAVTRTVAGTPFAEGLVCPHLVVEEKNVIVDGPAEGTFHAKPFLPGKPVLLGRETRGTTPAALQPVTLRFKRRAVFGEEWILADGRIEMEQGRPPDDGVSASADEVLIFLEKIPYTDSRPTDTDVGLVVLRGHSKYVSRDFDAASDVMKLNQVTKQATFFNETPTSFTIMVHRQVFNSEVENEVSRLDVDFKEPGSPKVTIRGHAMTVLPDSRSTGR